MPTKLLDTTFLIHYWAGREDVKTYLEAHEDTAEFVTTTINIKEIAVGRKLQGELDRAEILSKFGWLRIIPFSSEPAFQAGVLEASLRQDEGVNQAKVNSLFGDLLIAAVAKDIGATVVTENVADFEALGVPAESYVR